MAIRNPIVIAISLSPNTDFKDVKLALKLLFQPWQWQQGKAIQKVEEEIKDYLSVKEAITFANGRQSLFALLKSLGIKEGDEVLIQAYTCVVVPNSIISCGAKPVYVDIDPESFNLDPQDLAKKITPRSKILLVQHTFGHPAKMEEINKLAHDHNLILIEDACHALGSEYQAKKIGTFGLAAFFSFGRDKVISSVFGGVIVTNDRELAKRLKQLKNQAPYPSRFWIFQQLLHPLLFHFLILPLYFFFSIGKIILLISQKLKILSRAVIKPEKKGQFPGQVYRYPHALALLALTQLKKLDKMNLQRRQTARIYSHELKNLPLKLPQINKDSQSIFLRYTIKTEKAKELIRFARKNKIILGDWYSPVIAPKGVAFKKVFYQPGNCPKAEEAARQSVNLPTYPRMSLKDVERVVSVVKEFCNSEL